MSGSPADDEGGRSPLVASLVGSAALSAAVVGSGWASENGLGAPRLWPWLLTGLQVLSLWSAGRERWWGWLLGASVQPPWIAYAVMTGQLGFIPGCAFSAGVQWRSYLRGTARAAAIRTPAPSLG
jgi:hypothetical protein